MPELRFFFILETQMRVLQNANCMLCSTAAHNICKFMFNHWLNNVTIINFKCWLLCDRDFIGDIYVKNTGYNEVAEVNNIIMLYPQGGTPVYTGCWDVLGYLGPDYGEFTSFLFYTFLGFFFFFISLSGCHKTCPQAAQHSQHVTNAYWLHTLLSGTIIYDMQGREVILP